MTDPTSRLSSLLTDRLAQAAGDPGSIVMRHDGEPTSRWIARAAASMLGYVQPPTDLDARYVATAHTIHCSHCGDAYENEFGPVKFTAEQLHKLGEYALTDEGWTVNLNGLYDEETGGRKLLCPQCSSTGWCDVCDEAIRAWQSVTNTVDVGVVHEGCAAPMGATSPAAEALAR